VNLISVVLSQSPALATTPPPCFHSRPPHTGPPDAGKACGGILLEQSVHQRLHPILLT